MKVIIVIWRDPAMSIREETFDATKFKVRTDPGWLKITNDVAGVIRLIPSDKVCLVQFVDQEEPSRIVSPHLTAVKTQTPS